MKLFSVIFMVLAFFISGCGAGKAKEPGEKVKVDQFSNNSSVTIIASKPIKANEGGTIDVIDMTGLVNKTTLDIPKDSLEKDTEIKATAVNNPQGLPLGLNFVGTPTDWGPDGTNFKQPATIKISFSDKDLAQAGVASKSALKLYTFDKKMQKWSEAKVISIDTINNVVVGEVNHFSFYGLAGFMPMPPLDIGKPQPGDLIFCLSNQLDYLLLGWYPGHVGVFTGEKKYVGGKASEDVKRCGFYNVVEALWDGVQFSYYNLPGVETSCTVSTRFEGNAMSMGYRKPKGIPLTFSQRMEMVKFVEEQVGKPYVKGQTYGVTFGLLQGRLVKGPDSFNCVGLVEAGLEKIKYRNGEGLIDERDEYPILSPAQMYFNTEPANGEEPEPVINWSTLTPSAGYPNTVVLAQISVSHPYGLSYIDSVTYITSDGVINKNIKINDEGFGGDKVAGDGIYSASAPAGKSKTNLLVLKFIVTDKNGRSVETELSFIYLPSIALKSVSEKQSNNGEFTWAP